MTDSIIVRYGEIFTKSEPVKRQFSGRLARNMRAALPGADVAPRRNRIYVSTRGKADALKRVFGITSFSPAISIPADMDAINKTALALLRKSKKGSFAVASKRLTEDWKISPHRMNVEIGQVLKDGTGRTVNLDNPDVTIGVEVYGSTAYISNETIPGPGGLPLGTQGKAVAIFDGTKSLAACWMAMKRGLEVIPVCASKKLAALAKPLEKWAYGTGFRIVVSKDNIENVAKSENAQAIITSETLAAKKFAQYGMLALQPLVGMDAKGISRIVKAVR